MQNGGTDEIVALERRFIANHPGAIGVADFIQFAGAVGISNCPGAPRLQFLKGRKDATRPAPDGTVPLPFDDIGKVRLWLPAGYLPPSYLLNIRFLLAWRTVAA